MYEREDLPIVDIPSDKELLYRRKLVSEYNSVKTDRTHEINRLHTLFLQCGITDVTKAALNNEKNRQTVLAKLSDYEAEQTQRLCVTE